jgi:hypothetical protein
MRTNVVLLLILKDWRLHRHVIIFSIVAGALALEVLSIGGQTPVVFGAAFFYISMAFCACILPMSNIVNERKKQTLPFLMGLPVSAARYGAAKLISTVGMFLLPWLTLVGAALYTILGRHVLPHGAIPVTLILANLPLIGFCLITGTTLVAESEGWGIAVLAIVNSSYWMAWYLLISYVPSLTRTWAGPVAVWNRGAVNTLGAEFAVILLILGPTLYLQSRKRNFL